MLSALYAMAAGRSPFRADSTMAVLKRVCEVRHRPIRELNPDVPDWLEATIDRLLAKEPADRFQAASEVADLLEKWPALSLQQPAPVAASCWRNHREGVVPDLDFDLLCAGDREVAASSTASTAGVGRALSTKRGRTRRL